jgi:hypothetical protein
MATTYSTSFYQSSGAIKVDRAMSISNAGGLLGTPFSETIGTDVIDAADEHYMFPVPAGRRFQGFLLAHGDGDTNTTPALDADLVVRTVLNGVTTDTVIYDASVSGPFSVSGVAGEERELSSPPKAGATAGWVVAGATNLAEATLPASQTGSTLVVPVRGLKVGDTVTAYKVSAQIQSVGGTVTLDADLRKLTNAAADPVDASVGAITQVSVTAQTAVAASKTGLSDIVGADEWFYVLITATTAASTDIRYLGTTVTTTKALSEITPKWVHVNALVANSDSGLGHVVFKTGTAAATPAAFNLTVIPLIT